VQVKILTKNQEKILDTFVASHPYGSLEQSWAWGELQTQIPGRPDFYVLGVLREKNCWLPCSDKAGNEVW
jgi:hypothetical protein